MTAHYRVTWLAGLPYPVRNTLRRWRSLLGMMLGVGIALGVSMTMVAATNASIAYYTIDFRRSAADLYVLTKGGTLIPILPSDSPGTIKDATSTLSQVRGLPEVNAAVGFMTWPMVRDREGPRRRDEPAELVTTVGVDGDPTTIPNMLVLNEGRWLRSSNEAVVGPRLSREKGLHIGDSLRLGGRNFNIVGIGKLRGLGAGVAGDAVAYMDYRTFRQRADLGDVMSVIAVDARQPDAARRQILDLESTAVYNIDDLARQANEANAAGVGIYWVMIGLTLAIAGLFVNNMLAHSVSERRLEFATLRAIGIPSRTILLTVASEAILISVAAGLLGVALSLMLGALLNATVATAYGIETLYVADPGLFLLIFGLSLGLGLISGLMPARRATRVDPVEVLREA